MNWSYIDTLLKYFLNSHRTSSVTHPDVTFYIECRRSSEPKGLHVRVHLSLEHSGLRPRTAETRDQLIVYRTSGINHRYFILLFVAGAAGLYERVTVVHEGQRNMGGFYPVNIWYSLPFNPKEGRSYLMTKTDITDRLSAPWHKHP